MGCRGGKDQTSNLVIRVSIASGNATAVHLPWKLGGTGDPRPQFAESSKEVLLLALFLT